MKEFQANSCDPVDSDRMVSSGSRHPDDALDCEELLRFETMLTDISSRFCTVSAQDVDQEIESAQRRVCEELGLDLSAVWQMERDDPGVLVMTHLYRAHAGPPAPDRMEASEHHPWFLEQVRARRTVVISSHSDLPPEAARDLEAWREYGVKTGLCVPLAIGDDPPFGAVSFNDVISDREWTDMLIHRLELVAQVFANAIVRKRKNKELRLSEARLKVAADAAGTGLWSLDLASRRFWVTDRARRLFENGPDDVITFEGFLDQVHPDDRQLIRDAVDDVLGSGRDIDIEYRIILGDGSVRWMASRGNLQQENAEDPQPALHGATIDVTERKEAEARLRLAYEEVEALREQLQQENLYLQTQVRNESGHETVVGESEPVRRMLVLARNVAATDAAVLIQGETGTGKELLVQVIHDLSSRKRRTMVKVNCAALPAPLIESELFGRERGAYTGAMTRQSGRFEAANGSTIMLDEVGELPLELQAKLLRVLEDGSFERLGSLQVLTTDARIIASTNRDLAAMVDRGEFREDLYHRLNVFPIEVPPLRERGDDIALLVWKFVRDFNEKMGRSIESIPRGTMRKIREYAWPGNVRELRNVVERAMILSTGRTLELTLPANGRKTGVRLATLQDLERRHINEVLDHVHWRISGNGGAAEILGMVPTTLHSRMKKLGIKRPGT